MQVRCGKHTEGLQKLLFLVEDRFVRRDGDNRAKELQFRLKKGKIYIDIFWGRFDVIVWEWENERYNKVF